MTIVVLDANAMPHGHFNGRVLGQLNDILGAHGRLVVPEVVVWEWAEHAFSAQLTLDLAIRQHRVDPSVIPAPRASPAPPIDDVVAAITKVLVDSDVEIWRPQSETWRDSLRQQVLQVGSGEVKKDVKTGAADAVVLACTEALWSAYEPPVVLLSSDSKLRGRAVSEISGLLVANGVRDVLTQLNSFEPAPDDLELRASEVLPGILNDRVSDGNAALRFDEFGVDVYAGDGKSSIDPEIKPTRIDFSQVDLVEFHDFEVTRVDDSRFGLGNMRIFGEFELSIVEQRETTPGTLELVGDVVGPFSMAYVDVTVAIRWDLGWQFEDITATGKAVAVLGDDEWDEESGDVPPFRATVAD